MARSPTPASSRWASTRSRRGLSDDEALTRGVTLTNQQVFHGENAGVIDKFYSQALAAAIGFTPVVDPVSSCSPASTRMEFTATSADDTFFITARNDFTDDWCFS